jgi:hypothetical protein
MDVISEFPLKNRRNHPYKTFDCAFPHCMLSGFILDEFVINVLKLSEGSPQDSLNINQPTKR